MMSCFNGDDEIQNNLYKQGSETYVFTDMVYINICKIYTLTGIAYECRRVYIVVGICDV